MWPSIEAADVRLTKLKKQWVEGVRLIWMGPRFLLKDLNHPSINQVLCVYLCVPWRGADSQCSFTVNSAWTRAVRDTVKLNLQQHGAHLHRGLHSGHLSDLYSATCLEDSFHEWLPVEMHRTNDQLLKRSWITSTACCYYSRKLKAKIKYAFNKTPTSRNPSGRGTRWAPKTMRCIYIVKESESEPLCAVH